MEIAGRVYDSRNYIMLNPSSQETYKAYLKRCMSRTTQLRNMDSAVEERGGRET